MSNKFYIERLNDELIQACEEGDLLHVRHLITAVEVKSHYGLHANVHAQKGLALIKACEHGHLQVVRFLVASPEIPASGQHNAYPRVDNSAPLRKACMNGHLEIAQYLMESPEIIQAGGQWACPWARAGEAFIHASLKGHVHILKYLFGFLDKQPPLSSESSSVLKSCLHIASEGGQLEVVKYLLTAPELRGQEHMDKEYCLRLACGAGKVDIARYLLKSPDIKTVKGIEPIFQAFKEAHKENHLEVVKFFIWEHGVKRTPKLDKYIAHHPELQQMFELRDMKNHLQQTLPESMVSSGNKRKI